MSLITVALAACNGEKYLNEQIQSILTQSCRNLELVVVDDASDDRSFEVASEAARKDARVKVFQNASRLGVKMNFMKALSLAKGDYVAFSDQDDVWKPQKLEILKGLLDREKDSRLAYSDLEVCDEALRPVMPSFWRMSGIRPRKGRSGAKTILRNLAPGCSMLLRKELAGEMMRVSPESGFMHDHLAFVLASMNGGTAFTPEALVKYRQHASNMIGAKEGAAYDETDFFTESRQRLAAIEELFPSDAGLAALRRFIEGRGRKFEPAFVPFQLFRRPDVLKQQVMGFSEAFFPSVFDKMRKMKKGE